MTVFFAVLDDLLRFAMNSIFGSVVLNKKRRLFEESSKPLQPLLPLLSSAVKQPTDVELVSAHGSYFVNVSKTAVRIDPVAGFDNVLTSLTYGSQITVLKYGGRWAMIQAKDISGWVLKDDISSSADEVFPNFMVGSVYDANNETTKKVRLYIDDMFECTEPGLPLTSAEYVTYRLARAGRRVNWSHKRPRLPGQWQSLLRGRVDIHIGVTPKTASIMECIDEEQGNLLYVEAVFPDGSIQISSVDYEGVGVYTESVLDKEVWRELHPVFIEVL